MNPLEWQVAQDGTCRAKMGRLRYVVAHLPARGWCSLGFQGPGVKMLFCHDVETPAKGQRHALWQHALRCHSLPLPPAVKAWLANPLPLP